MADLLSLTTRANIDLQAAAGNPKPATISALAYGGGVLPIDGNRYIIALDGLTAPASVPLLRDHDNQVGSIIGSVRPAKKNNSIFVEGVLARGTPAADQVIALAQAGVELGVSVGVEPEAKTYVAPGQTTKANGKTFTADSPGLIVVTKSNLREISLVAVPADRSARASIAATSSKGFNMNTDNQPNDEATIDTQLIAKLPENQSGLSDIERVQARWAREAWHDPAGLPRQRAEAAMLRAAAGKITYSDFERELLTERVRDAEIAAIRAERPVGPAIHGSRRGKPAADAPAILGAASMLYFGREKLGEKSYGPEAMQAARELGLRSVYDLARFALHERHVEAPAGGVALLKAAFSTTGLTNTLGDSAGKIARAAFEEQPATWRSWNDIVPVSDFRSKTLLRVGHAFGLEELGAAAEIKHGMLSETAASVRAATYARMIAIPRQHLVNDDLGLIPQVAADFGRMAMRKVANLVYTNLLANPSSFFAEGEGNLIDNPLGAPGLAAAVKAFRNQADMDGEPVDIRPAVLLVPPSLEQTGRALLASQELQRYVADGTDERPSGNPFAGLNLTLEVEPRLESDAYTGHSDTVWFLIGPPSAQAGVVCFLAGQQGPIVESQDADFDKLGTQWRCFIDTGCGLCDARAIVMSSGDAV